MNPEGAFYRSVVEANSKIVLVLALLTIVAIAGTIIVVSIARQHFRTQRRRQAAALHQQQQQQRTMPSVVPVRPAHHVVPRLI